MDTFDCHVTQDRHKYCASKHKSAQFQLLLALIKKKEKYVCQTRNTYRVIDVEELIWLQSDLLTSAVAGENLFK